MDGDFKMTNEIAKQLVDECREKCIENMREMYKQIDEIDLTTQQKHAVKVLLRARVANFLWSMAYPQAMEVIADNMENKDYMRAVQNE